MADQQALRRCEEASRRVRRRIVTMSYATGKTGAHLGGGLSLVEVLTCLYSEVARLDPSNPQWEERDRIILSKGHGALALYPAMVEGGILPEESLQTFKQDGSKLGGHPSLNGLPGIEFASGSLGQGLSLGVGVCLALRRKRNETSRVFVVLGDGECDEGSVWEAAASAAHFGCDRLVAVVDVNQIQYDGATSAIMDMSPFEDKWKSFGWDVLSFDGHDLSAVLDALAYKTDRPVALLAKTVKGKGVSFMEGNWRWHNAVLTKGQYEQALQELGEVSC